MKGRLNKMLACLFAGILTATAADYSVFAAQDSIYTYYVCPNSKLLREDETDYSEMVENGKLLFSAAANERESAQIILTKEGKYENFTLELEDDLKDENGNTIPKTNFEIFFEHYVKAEKFWALDGSHNDENGKKAYDFYPDALIPEELAREVGANTFKLGGDKKNQGLWFTVTVPPKTPAGIYRSRLTGSLEVDVEVKVYDFELPTVTNSRTFFNADTVHLPADGDHLQQNLKGIVGMFADDTDNAKKLYYETIDQFLNNRKVSSGYKYGLFSEPDTLQEDVQSLIKYIQKNETRAPYYNLCSSYFDYGSMKDNEFQPFKCPARIIRYNGNIKKNNEPDVPAIGIEDLLKEIVTRCIDEKFDYLQFAFLYLGRDDESPFDSEAANIRTLVNSYIFEEIKEAVKDDIDVKAKNLDPELKKQLVSSLEQIPFIHTVTPTENSGNWSDILYQGLEIKGYGKDGKENYSEDYSKLFPDGDKNQFKIKIPNDSTLKSFCPLFNDFSSNTYVKNTEASQLSENLAEYQKSTDFWWYSCNQSGKDACLPGYMINCNRGVHLRYMNDTNPDILSMNSLAVSRANKWQQFNLGILGEIYWAVDAFRYVYEYKYPGKHSEYSIPRDVSYPYCSTDTELVRSHQYLKPDIGITATGGDDYTASDGMLIYPVKQLLKNVYGIKDEGELNSMAEKYGYFCSSIRLENIGESNDDYDYLCLAEKLTEAQNRINGIIQQIIEPGNIDYTNPELTNSSNLEQARDQLAAMIEGRTSTGKKITAESSYTIFLSDYDVQDVQGWKNSNMALCFDVFETNTYQNETKDRTTTFTLSDGREGLSNLMKIDFAQKKITLIPGNEIEGSALIPKGNGWYQVILPLGSAPVNIENDPNGTGTLRAVYFDKRYIKQSFIVDNFKVLTEITAKYSYTFFLSDYDVQDVQGWKNSNMALCFDVFETNTYQNETKDRTTTFTLSDGREGLSNLMKIDFAQKKITLIPGNEIEGSALIPKGNGWYQVILPLGSAPVNSDLDPDGTGTLRAVYFDKRYIKQSFIVDNFKVLKEITSDSTNSNNSVLLLPPVDNWSSSNKILSFDVYETDKQSSGHDRTAVFTLVDNKHDDGWKAVSEMIKISFADKTVKRWDGAKITGASLVDLGAGWYQVILPLNAIPTPEDACKKYPISIIHFDPRYVFRSFLVDNFRVVNNSSISIHAQPAKVLIEGDLNGDGCEDKTDVIELQNYLTGKNKNIQTSWQEADLDHNGILNGVDKTLLKRMILSQ